ncbi:bifunctional serine/threonine-protein kinase/formylglycine-generating enzyme family protein [Lamprocystis purpurea]|uniref:bifunctional serine/threonine-protein kinase/formylglycine-generating enzyme family protein n=1 Tax=Lamprocystis purpurea TaxID=61598 RepID=UPI0003A0BDA4|nr:bifunctional serine/threonine-protein kinase/formylglycine-generating enzyme family protein [Lamprocystis purpurea]
MTEPNADHLCPGCFAEKGGANPCPHCGYDEQAERAPLLLPHRTLLNGQFLIGRVLGKPGGFGITYLAWDLGLHRRVAIKEYLPRELAGRGTDRATIAPHSREDADAFRYGLEQFLAEARTLARLDHPNIVRVHQVFEANGTACLAMEYYAGLTLADYLDRKGGRLAESEALLLMQPILDGLRAVHAKGFLHRDIKPQNIYLAQMDGGGVRPILLDFGAARQAMGERSRSLSVLVSEGYAPFEQYTRKGKQGAWTDVYAAGAVLYRMVTGQTPPPANDRMAGDDLVPAGARGVSQALSDTLNRALALQPENRPLDVPALQAALWPRQTAEHAATPPPRASAPAAPPKVAARRPVTSRPQAKPKGPHLAEAVLAGVLLVIVSVGGLSLWGDGQHQAADPVDSMTPEVDQRGAVQQPRQPFDPKFEPEMVSIPAGTFLMGSPASEPERADDEGPQHQVQVPAFELGKTEVTFDQWDACVTANGCKQRPEDAGWGRGTRPVIDVSWDDAQAYVEWLSVQTGTAYRLPSEAEWEYAARAGTKTPFSTGRCINTDQANYDGRYDYNGCGAKTGVSHEKTQPVGSYPANRWGLYDVHGNVWEWVQDCYHDSYTGAPKDESEWRDSCKDSGWSVLRGGSWDDSPQFLRSANRNGNGTGYRDFNLGFRVARTLTP